MPGGAIGLFETTAPAGVFENLSKLTATLKASVSPMRPDTPVAYIRLRDRTWSAPRPSEAWEAHGPLRTEVLRLAGEAEKQPVRALQVRLVEARTTEIAVELSNPGSQAVELDWKKVRIKAEGFIEMTKLPPDPTGKGPAPLPPANVTVGQYQASADAPKQIEARGKLIVKIAVRFQKPGAWKIQARYECLSLPDGSKGIEGRANSGATVAVP
jgi:hypothetical protein